MISASSDLAAFVKLGLFPLFRSAHNVNWLISKIEPLTSLIERFILLFLSLKTLKPSTFFKILSTSSFLSVFSTPRNKTKPFFIDVCNLP